MAASLQKRLKTLMKKKDWRMADLARALGHPYTTVREWVLEGRRPIGDIARQVQVTLKQLEA